MTDRKPPVVRDNTPEEEAAIQRQIAEDPDTWSVPPEAPVRRRGRPQGQNKALVTLRLDKDLLERLRSQGKGWQTRANALLRKALEM